MINENLNFTVAIFPYLKTTAPVTIGPYTFRSTDDILHLSPAESKAVTEITEMLFIQNDARVRSASYTILSLIAFDSVHPIPEDIERVQALIAYFYATPHETFGDTFLPFECATLLLMTPCPVNNVLIEAQHHVIHTRLSNKQELLTDTTDGYAGLMNFRQHLWVTKGSRVYPPIPNITLNISQNLAADCSPNYFGSTVMIELLSLLNNKEFQVAARIFTAIEWYNATNRRNADDSEALMCLAIAFEALLQLPQGEKTDRFVDSVSLLLGRIPRLTEWVKQFYDARSLIAHEGKLSQNRFTIKRGSGKAEQVLVYHPLLVFGRQVFRLCLAAVSHGAELARVSDLAAKLTTNCERYEALCRHFDTSSLIHRDTLENVQRLISEIKRYRFVSESGISVALIIGATQRAAKNLLSCKITLIRLTNAVLTNLIEPSVSNDEFKALSALYTAELMLKERRRELPEEIEQVVCELINVAWMYTFQRYFDLLSTNKQVLEAIQPDA